MKQHHTTQHRRLTSCLKTFLLCGIAAGCGHGKKPALAPAAKQAVAETRGLCPTDIHQTQMLVRDGGDKVGVIFMSRDPSKVEELSRRAAEIGEALASVHPAINEGGTLVQHVPAPKPQLEELASTGGYGVELVFRPSPEQKPLLLENLNDHEGMWRRGECPIMSDESVRKHETSGWSRPDR